MTDDPTTLRRRLAAAERNAQEWCEALTQEAAKTRRLEAEVERLTEELRALRNDGPTKG